MSAWISEMWMGKRPVGVGVGEGQTSGSAPARARAPRQQAEAGSGQGTWVVPRHYTRGHRPDKKERLVGEQYLNV